MKKKYSPKGTEGNSFFFIFLIFIKLPQHYFESVVFFDGKKPCSFKALNLITFKTSLSVKNEPLMFYNVLTKHMVKFKSELI